MASSGPLSAGTGATTTGWANPTNVTASDDARATISDASVGAFVSNDLRALTFGFAIPTGATVDGIVVEIERSVNATTQTPRDHTIQLQKLDNTPVGDNKASGTTWPTTDAYATYGSSSDLWGLTWTPAEINATGFGVYMKVQTNAGKGGPQFRVDHVRITVYYTESGNRRRRVLTSAV